MPHASAAERFWTERLPLVALTPFTLQDFPGRSACILWFSGCQMRCPYCHNPDFALGRGARIDVGAALGFLERRRTYLEGVTFSGGECLLSPAVVEMARAVRDMGYAIKIDTNGATPERLATLLDAGLVDYVALDFKAPLDDYARITGWADTPKWERSFELLRASGLAYELRTTVRPDLLDEAAVARMLDYLAAQAFRGTLYLQHYRHAPRTLGNLEDSPRRFNLARLPSGYPFQIHCRNFTARERPAAVGV